MTTSLLGQYRILFALLLTTIVVYACTKAYLQHGTINIATTNMQQLHNETEILPPDPANHTTAAPPIEANTAKYSPVGEQFSSDYWGNDTKLVLLYTKWYGSPLWFLNGSLNGTFYTLDTDGFSCPKKCLYTYDRSFTDSADLVFLNIIDMNVNEKTEVPAERSPHQVWAAFICETPVNIPVTPHVRSSNNRFNWTATYRLDSDVYWPSGHFHPRKHPLDPSLITPTLADAKRKTKLAAWIVSNCNTDSRREVIVERLKKKMNIDVYGICGNNHCPPEGNCREAIAKDYKFYLSFENSLCVDYATEKFFEAFAYDMIPITYGLANYTKIAPPNSYINLLDFKNLDEFVDYIEFLDKNPQEYLKYFQWKQDFLLISKPTKSGLCNACIKLHENQRKKTVVPNFTYWWIHSPLNMTFKNKRITIADSVCISPQETGLL